MNKVKYALMGVVLLIAIVTVVLIISRPVTTTIQDVKVLEDGTLYLVHPDEIRSSVPKDAIPPLDNPNFISVQEADEWIEDDELVLAFTHKDETYVYPLQIMMWHEIVNQNIQGDPILITYCPLCGSGIAFLRRIGLDSSAFGNTGSLYQSNLVMYDRDTESYWTQIGGLAIIGPHTGIKLKPLPIDTVVWRDWKVAHPHSFVLSRETGFDRPYGEAGHGAYKEHSFRFDQGFRADGSLPSRAFVYGLEVNGNFRAYLEADLIEFGEIEDTIDNTRIRITRQNDGVVRAINVDKDEEIILERDFWFAWLAFHPSTDVYK